MFVNQYCGRTFWRVDCKPIFSSLQDLASIRSAIGTDNSNARLLFRRASLGTFFRARWLLGSASHFFEFAVLRVVGVQFVVTVTQALSDTSTKLSNWINFDWSRTEGLL